MPATATSAPFEYRTLEDEADTLHGGKVLPGFTLAVKMIFASRAPAKKTRKGKK